MHWDPLTGKQIATPQQAAALRSQQMQGMAAYQRLRQQQAAAKAKRDIHLEELWGPIRVGSGVLLSEKATITCCPGVRTSRGIIRLDGVVKKIEADTATVQVLFLSPRKSQGVQPELITLNRDELVELGHEPTAWVLSDLRISAMRRNRNHGRHDDWVDPVVDRYVED